MTAGRRAGWLVFAAAVVFFSLGAASRGLWHADEHRTAEVARVMTSGGDWLVPHLDGEIYAHKPPLFYWIAAFVHGPLGADLAIADKIPSIVGGAAAVLAVFLIARRLHGDAAGAAAAVVLATAAEFDWFARRGNLDALLTGFTTLSLWCFVRVRFPGPADERPRAALWSALGFACAGLGCMAKGPVAFAVPAVVIVVFAASSGEMRTLVTPRLARGVALALLPGAAWIVAASVKLADLSYARDLVVGQGVGHPMGEVDKVEPFWFYARSFPRSVLPWTLLAPAGVAAATAWRRPEERRADLFALSWVAAGFVFLSCFPAKRPVYLMPVLPGVALLVAKLASVAQETLRSAWFAVPRFALGALALALGVAAVAVAGLVMSGSDDVLANRLDWWESVRGAQGSAGPFLAAALGGATAWFGWRTLRDASPRRAFDHVQSAVAMASVAYAAVALPCADAAISSRRFYDRAAALIGDAPVARFGVDDYAGHWSMRRDVIRHLDRPGEVAKFLAKSQGPAFVVAERGEMQRSGVPASVRVVLEERLPLDEDLLLLAKE